VAIWLLYDWLVTAGGMLAAAGVADGTLPANLHPNDALLVAVTYALPVGLVGIFLAGVLATSMSTIDSYSLVAGANFSYDLYRPLRKPDATDRELVRMTKIGIVVAWCIGYVLAFMFSRLMSLWVFNASLLTSTVLVPIFAALYGKGKRTPLAGLLSCAFGAAAVILYYVGLQQIGDYDETWGTFIWTFQLGGNSYSIWQEYALFFTLPVSLLGFLIGNLLGKPPETSAPAPGSPGKERGA
jgi:Na+/proline symporter